MRQKAKKGKLRIKQGGHGGNERVVFGDDGEAMAPLEALGVKSKNDGPVPDGGEELAAAAKAHYDKIRAERLRADKHDRLREKERLRDIRNKERMKRRKADGMTTRTRRVTTTTTTTTRACSSAARASPSPRSPTRSRGSGKRSTSPSRGWRPRTRPWRAWRSARCVCCGASEDGADESIFFNTNGDLVFNRRSAELFCYEKVLSTVIRVQTLLPLRAWVC